MEAGLIAPSRAPIDGRGDDEILVVQGKIAVVTLNRPRKKNALSLAMWRRVATVFDDLGQDAAVRAIVLTGSESFCAGADISEFATVRATAEQGAVYEHAVEAAQLAIVDSPKPTIAAISGFCIGGGMEIAQSCDFRVADGSAAFSIPAARLGIVYGEFACRRLVSLVGLTHAKTILFSGERFDAEAAARFGFCESVEGDAMNAALALAGRLADNAPLSIAGMKLILDSVSSGTADARRGDIEAAMRRALTSDDYREAVAAFQSRRTPRFKGS